MKLDDIILALQREKKKYGNTKVQVFTTESGDNVSVHDIENIHDSWWYNKKGDVISIEIDLDKHINVHE